MVIFTYFCFFQDSLKKKKRINPKGLKEQETKEEPNPEKCTADE